MHCRHFDLCIDAILTAFVAVLVDVVVFSTLRLIEFTISACLFLGPKLFVYDGTDIKLFLGLFKCYITQ